MESAVHLFDSSLLRKPTMRKVGALNPNSRGITSLVKALSDPIEVEAPQKGIHFGAKHYEVTCGDDTAQVILSLREHQLEGMVPGKVLLAQNAACHVVQGYIRLVVDKKWGKLDFNVEESIDEIGEYNISKIEFELVSNH